MKTQKIMTKEAAVDFSKRFCEAENFKTIKEYRSFAEYYLCGEGNIDDDFSCDTKRFAKMRTKKEWQKLYAMLEDTDIILA